MNEATIEFMGGELTLIELTTLYMKLTGASIASYGDPVHDEIADVGADILHTIAKYMGD